MSQDKAEERHNTTKKEINIDASADGRNGVGQRREKAKEHNALTIKQILSLFPRSRTS